MDDEEGGADAPRQGRNTNRASMHDAGTRETAGIRCREKEERNRVITKVSDVIRRNRRRRNGVCQTPATAKKKKPDGFQNWLHVHNACWRIGLHDPVAAV